MYDKGVQCRINYTLILMDNLVISFQEPEGGDAFDIIRTRLRQAKGRVRKLGADYLFLRAYGCGSGLLFPCTTTTISPLIGLEE